MNPQTPDQNQDQQGVPQMQDTPVASSPEADAAALQAIDALESETDVNAAPEAPVTPQSSEPAPAPFSPNVESAPTVVSNEMPVAPVPPTEAPVESTEQTFGQSEYAAAPAPAADPVATPTPEAPVTPTETPMSQPAATPFTAQQPAADTAKKTPLIIAAVVAGIVVVGVLAGFFIWQMLAG